MAPSRPLTSAGDRPLPALAPGQQEQIGTVALYNPLLAGLPDDGSHKGDLPPDLVVGWVAVPPPLLQSGQLCDPSGLASIACTTAYRRAHAHTWPGYCPPARRAGCCAPRPGHPPAAPQYLDAALHLGTHLLHAALAQGALRVDRTLSEYPASKFGLGRKQVKQMEETIPVQITEKGILIPIEALGELERTEIEVAKDKGQIVIRPKPQLVDEPARVAQVLREAGLLYEPDWEQPPPISFEERARLAQKLTTDPPLSEVIIADR